MRDNEDHIHSLVEKAAKSHSADEAMKYSQAANNAANAMITLASAKAACRDLHP